jgi:hypothetical protein
MRGRLRAVAVATTGYPSWCWPPGDYQALDVGKSTSGAMAGLALVDSRAVLHWRQITRKFSTESSGIPSVNRGCTT